MTLFKKKQVKTAAAGGGIVTAAMVSAFMFIASATNIGSPYTAEFEGTVLDNYIDSVGVETWCIGETQMGRLDEGYTKEYCLALFKASYANYSSKLYECYNNKAKRYVTPAMHAAFTDVYYNTGALCKTGMIRMLKQGRPEEACDYTLRYRFAGGQDCSKEDSNCKGVWKRRITLHPICMKDAKQIPWDGLGEEDG